MTATATATGLTSTIRREATLLVSPLETAVNALSVKSNDDYELADELLTRIRQAEAKWENKVNPIIEPQRAALDAAYKLKNEFLHPLQAMEAAVKLEMKAWKTEVFRIAAAAEQVKQAEVARLAREAALREQQLRAAKTAPMRAQLQQKQAAVQQQIADVQARDTAPASVKVAGSQVRRRKKGVVTDRALVLQGIYQGKIPASLFLIDTAELARWVKDDPDTVAKWPGIEIVDDIVIAGR